MDDPTTQIPGQEPVGTNPEAEDQGPSLFKQVMGAVIGGGLALGLYYGYDFAKPKVTAYLTLPVAEGGRLFDLGATSIADKSLEDEERKRFASKNAQAAARLEGRSFDNSIMQAVDNHDTDIDWAGHDIAAEEPDAVVADAGEAEEDFEVSIMEEEMATMEPEANEDNWDDLWGDISDREGGDHERVERSNAKGLPDTGIGIGFVAFGAAGGAWGARKKKK